MPEISAEQLQRLQNAQALLDQANSNPESRRHIERAIKVLNPAVETEEDVTQRLAKPYVEQIDALRNDLKAMADAQAKRDADAQKAADEARVNGSLGWLERQGFTDEGKEAIKTIMVTEHIPNVEAAAALFEKRNPKPVAIPGANYEGESWNFRGDENDADLKSLFSNEDKWSDLEVPKALNDYRRAVNNAQAA